MDFPRLPWMRRAARTEPTLAARLAADDARHADAEARFAASDRPLLRWRCDATTDQALLREAICLTTQALGGDIDYALATTAIAASRVRAMLELSTQPVHWRKDDGQPPSRIRTDAPELALDGAIALTGRPSWFEAWQQGDAAIESGDAAIRALPPCQHDRDRSAAALADSDAGFFQRLAAAPRRAAPDLIARFAWLGNHGQWGMPGWSIADPLAAIVVARAARFAGKRVLELGTSRGRLAAMLAGTGCTLVTVDHQDRGAGHNLAGLAVDVVRQDLVRFLDRAAEPFDLIVCDLHGNSPAQWRRYRKPLMRALAPGGTLIVNNAALHRLDDWRSESGVAWFLSELPRSWRTELHLATLPGIAIVSRP